MEDVIRLARGYTRLELTGAFPEGTMNALAANGVEFWAAESIDAYTLRLTAAERDIDRVKRLAAQSMCDVRIIYTRGGSEGRRLLHRRRYLIIAALVLTALLMWSSLYVWDIEVTGNGEVTRGEVLRLLADSGVRIGTYWPDIDADTVRSRVLLREERIAWMTVNVRSSRAYVVIRECGDIPDLISDEAVCDLVAKYSGVISSVSVLRGKPLVTKGQAVCKGDILASGTVDSITNAPREVCALGEVWAHTYRELCSKCPAILEKKAYTGASSNRFAIIVGEKRINFYSDSRKTDDKCDKITHTYRCALNGAFALPITLVREEYIEYDTANTECTDSEVRAMTERLYSELDGTEFSEAEVCTHGGAVVVTLRAQCLENIASVRRRDREDIL